VARGVKTIPHVLFLPDLAPADFFLFPRVRESSKPSPKMSSLKLCGTGWTAVKSASASVETKTKNKPKINDFLKIICTQLIASVHVFLFTFTPHMPSTETVLSSKNVLALLEVSIRSTVQDMKVRGQLDCPEVKQKQQKKSCKLYICQLYMLYSAPMMFTCIKVLSPLVVKGGLYV
jgi:hypothetical protein